MKKYSEKTRVPITKDIFRSIIPLIEAFGVYRNNLKTCEQSDIEKEKIFDNWIDEKYELCNEIRKMLNVNNPLSIDSETMEIVIYNVDNDMVNDYTFVMDTEDGKKLLVAETIIEMSDIEKITLNIKED